MKFLKYKKLILSIFLIAAVLVWWSLDRYPVISKKDLIQQDTDQLAEMLETITPIGSSTDMVKNTIKHNLKRKYTLVRMDRIGPNMRRGRYREFTTIPEKNDQIIKCTLTTYGWVENFFCAGSVVDGLWLFDNNNTLKEIAVKRWADGM